ncbi:MAG TPA: hypothetical protein VFV38_16435 [Ktedonobacteraceae bacterium]|nr:hypothetical protein [Ktedonobacteraceae bacterium]
MNTIGTRNWRDILASLCENPQRRQEIAQTGVGSVRTLYRWISGQSNPQSASLVRQLALFDEELCEALMEAFPEAFASSPELPLDIERVSLSSEFYDRVIHAYAHTPQASRRWTIFHLVARWMLPHLDIQRAGLFLVYAHLLDGSAQAVKFEEGAGTGLWATRQILSPICTDEWLFQLISASHPLFVQADVSLPGCFFRPDLISSLGFFPFYRAGMVAGGLLLGSTQTDFFTPVRQLLIEKYSYPLSFMLSDSDFASR